MVICAGIDPSMTCTAASVFDQDGTHLGTETFQITDKALKVYEYDASPIPEKRAKQYMKIDVICFKLLEWLKPLKVEFVFIENYSFASKFNRELMAELGHGIRHELTDHRIVWMEVPPQTMKKYLSGKGNTPKSEIRPLVLNKYSENFDNVKPAYKNDAADAYVLGRMAVDWYNWKTLKYQHNPPCKYQYQIDTLMALRSKMAGE